MTPAAPAMAHLQWISSLSLNLSRLDGTLPRPMQIVFLSQKVYVYLNFPLSRAEELAADYCCAEGGGVVSFYIKTNTAALPFCDE